MLYVKIIYPLWYIFDKNYLSSHQKGYNSMTELAKYIKAKRREYGLTQVDISEKSGVGLRFVRELEQGKATLRLDKVNQVLSLFGAEMAPVENRPS